MHLICHAQASAYGRSGFGAVFPSSPGSSSNRALGIQCPIHCGSSNLSTIFLAAIIGFILGFLLAAALILLWIVLPPWNHPHTSFPASTPGHLRQKVRQRLQGYRAFFNEWGSRSFWAHHCSEQTLTCHQQSELVEPEIRGSRDCIGAGLGGGWEWHHIPWAEEERSCIRRLQQLECPRFFIAECNKLSGKVGIRSLASCSGPQPASQDLRGPSSSRFDFTYQGGISLRPLQDYRQTWFCPTWFATAFLARLKPRLTVKGPECPILKSIDGIRLAFNSRRRWRRAFDFSMASSSAREHRIRGPSSGLMKRDEGLLLAVPGATMSDDAVAAHSQVPDGGGEPLVGSFFRCQVPLFFAAAAPEKSMEILVVVLRQTCSWTCMWRT